jgi:hypothetical protein
VHSTRLFFRWVIFDARFKLSLEQDPAGPAYYGATAKGPLTLASVVHDFRVAWHGQKREMINEGACEVAMALLHHGDVEVGDLVGGKFIPWELTRWDAAEKIHTEMMAQPNFLEDEQHYIFRRK